MLPRPPRRCCSQIWGELTWIYTWILMFAVVVLGPDTVWCRMCSKRDLFSLQTPCLKENDDFALLIGSKRNKELCSALHELWFCTARNVPQCLMNMTEMYTKFTHSPHNCQLSRDEFSKLQKIHRESLSENEFTSSSTSSSRHSPDTATRAGGYTVVVSDTDDEGYNVTGHGHMGSSGSSKLVSYHVTSILLSLLTLTYTLPPVLK